MTLGELAHRYMALPIRRRRHSASAEPAHLDSAITRGDARIDEALVTPGLATLYLLAAAVYVWTYLHHAARPRSLQEPGWTVWFDQSYYYKAALAWAHGNLDPAQHWYLPGYALLAAPFARWWPLDAFLVPNTVALVVSIHLFGRLSAIVAPEIPVARLLGALIFTLCSVAMPTLLEVWVVPNSTTGSTPFVYGGLLAALRFIDGRQRPRQAFLAALVLCAVMAFRPSDAFAPIAGASLGMLLALVVRFDGWPATLSVVAAALAGATLSLLALGATYLALYGMHASTYVTISSALGFEWRLLPLRWVTIVLDPRPLLPVGEGLVHRFWWIVPGIAGAAAVFFTPIAPSRRIANITVITVVALNICIYLCYRDLHPTGLFQFSNYHYFKWSLPFLALYAFRFVWAVLFGERRLLVAVVGIAPLLALIPWRVELKPIATDEGPTVEADKLSFTENLSNLHDVLLIPTEGDPSRLFGGGHRLDIGGRTWGFFDVRTYPEPGGVMLVPLRPLGSGPATLKFEPGLGTFRTDVPAVLARQTIVFGLPCFILPSRPVCRPTQLIAARELPPGGTLRFDGGDEPYLSGDWSIVQDGSRWSEGEEPSIRFRLPADQRSEPFQLELDASPFVPENAPSLKVHLEVNGTDIADWTFLSGSRAWEVATVPTKLIPPDGQVDVTFRIENPRQPLEFYADSRDARRLGMLVRSVRVTHGL